VDVLPAISVPSFLRSRFPSALGCMLISKDNIFFGVNHLKRSVFWGRFNNVLQCMSFKSENRDLRGKTLELPSRHFQYAPMLVSHDQAPFK